ncbi:hypothetical protein [uncultured Erythrobacter sp.]|nr:hypothetical protein [uncultured Erythrobacter sp.]
MAREQIDARVVALALLAGCDKRGKAAERVNAKLHLTHGQSLVIAITMCV